MPQAAWSAKRERQYEAIKAGLLDRGTPEWKAPEIAARTVNVERVRAVEARSWQTRAELRRVVDG